MEMHPMISPGTRNIAGRPQRTNRKTLALLLGGIAPALLAGCGVGGSGTASQTAATSGSFQISGKVHGGQQPVVGATIQLYTVGTTGLKSASTGLVASTVTTASDGSFTLTGKYNCATQPATQVYITATGGNPGAGTNSALTMGAALGACTSLLPTTYTWINEVTTVAAAYALAPFAADYTHIGATGSNPTGLVNAFTNAALLANTTNGTAGGGALGAGVTAPVAELNTLANILASCVNTTGPTTLTCTTLFSATGASETFTAAIDIAKNPGASAIVALYNMPPPASPFAPALTTAPTDFSVAVTSTGNGTLSTPYGIAIDAAGNAWVTNESSAVLGVTGIAPSGSILNSFGYNYLAAPQGIAIDRSGALWIANTAGNSLLKQTVSATGAPLVVTNVTAGGISGPVSVALDSNGTAWVANLNGNSVTGITTSGSALSGSPFSGNSNITVPTSIAVGPTGLVYVTSGNGSVVTLTNAGAYSASLNDGTLQGPAGVAVDSSSRVLATGFTTGTAVGGALSEFTGGAAVASSPITSGLSTPAGVASDGTSIWVANDTTNGGLAQFSYTSTTPISPAAGFGSLNAPAQVAIDSSGSVWTTNSGSNTVSKFIGLANPVATPLAANVGP
jgi:hypothetical protein